MRSSAFSTANLVRYNHDASPQPHRPKHEAASDLTARLALDERTRTDAFSVRHESYLASGYLDPKPNGLYLDEYDDMPNSQTVVIYRQSRPVASIRVSILDTDPAVHGWDDVPALHLFPEELGDLMNRVNAGYEAAARAGGPRKHARALELNRLVRHPDFKDDSELVFVLFRFATYMVLHHDVDYALSCVRRNHMPFYRRVIRLENVAGPRHYPGLKFATHLVACSREKYASVVRDVPIFNSAKITQGGYDRLFDGETVNVFGES